mmetsp:Transcript_21920/g.51239  ORF Transcript_21920/g.51239 Transcript_21920/m.51239 type:complete len:527 (+) Transcript_21920:69-1649(+)
MALRGSDSLTFTAGSIVNVPSTSSSTPSQTAQQLGSTKISTNASQVSSSACPLLAGALAGVAALTVSGNRSNGRRSTVSRLAASNTAGHTWNTVDSQEPKNGASSGQRLTLSDTVLDACGALQQGFSEDGAPLRSESGAITWSIEEDEDPAVSGGQFWYTRVRADGFESRQATNIGSMLRRTLLRDDVFRSHAAAAVRLEVQPLKYDREAKSSAVEAIKFTPGEMERIETEFSGVLGVEENMIDIIENVSHLLVKERVLEEPLPLAALAASEDGVEAWRWAARCCGPCAIHASDLHIIDSSTHLERPLELTSPHQHLCKVSGDVIVDIKVEFILACEDEWNVSPSMKKYKVDRRRTTAGATTDMEAEDRGWMVLNTPRFRPTHKVGFKVVADKGGKESLLLEVWSKPTKRPRDLLAKAAELIHSSTLAAVAERDNQARNGQSGSSSIGGQDTDDALSDADQQMQAFSSRAPTESPEAVEDGEYFPRPDREYDVDDESDMKVNGFKDVMQSRGNDILDSFNEEMRDE